MNPRRSRLRKEEAAESTEMGWLTDPDIIYAGFIWLLFVFLSVVVLAYDPMGQTGYIRLAAIVTAVVLIALAAAFHISQYQKRLVRNRVRLMGLVILLISMLICAKAAVWFSGQMFWATATASAVVLILTIAFNQRFALAMIFFYCALASLAIGRVTDIGELITMLAAALPYCFFLKEIRTRMRLLEVSLVSAVSVFLMSTAMTCLSSPRLPENLLTLFAAAGPNAAVTLLVGIMIQGLLPVLEKVFRIATSMTLLDYSDANQPLLKRLAMEAPGTYSHSLLIGSIAEAAAEAIGRNGLLCRVGAYYHDIQLGSISWHKELSPAMSQLIIAGHVKDGMALAKEYGLPAVLRQFIETHHGTTLVEYFYNEAMKQHELSDSSDMPAPSEGAFRYPGPKPRTKEAAIVMLADAVESAARTLSEATPTKIEAVVHNIAMKRLQDGQFDECDLSLRELSRIEASMSKTLAAHHHGRISYPTPPEMPPEQEQ
jgi:putative nucleotidyltransferase with HDIG domain